MYIVHDTLRFEWDDRKASSNKRKHKISFEEAITAFFDDDALLGDDPDHSDDEDRFILLGSAVSVRLLVVCHCYRKAGNVIRIISARPATRNEQAQYRERIT